MAVDWIYPSSSADEAAQRAQLHDLREEHRALDAAVQALGENAPHDQLGLMRLKRRKLALKDQILKLENALTPDIIA
jgi:hypothetical protein